MRRNRLISYIGLMFGSMIIWYSSMHRQIEFYITQEKKGFKMTVNDLYSLLYEADGGGYTGLSTILFVNMLFYILLLNFFMGKEKIIEIVRNTSKDKYCRNKFIHIIIFTCIFAVIFELTDIVGIGIFLKDENIEWVKYLCLSLAHMVLLGLFYMIAGLIFVSLKNIFQKEWKCMAVTLVIYLAQMAVRFRGINIWIMSDDVDVKMQYIYGVSWQGIVSKLVRLTGGIVIMYAIYKEIFKRRDILGNEKT